MMDTQLTKRVIDWMFSTIFMVIIFIFIAQKRCSKRIKRNMAHLQTHKTCKKGQSRSGSHASKKIFTRNICVSIKSKNLSETMNNWTILFNRLRKVKMDQRKLMDNANTITDMAKVKAFYD